MFCKIRYVGSAVPDRVHLVSQNRPFLSPAGMIIMMVIAIGARNYNYGLGNYNCLQVGKLF